MRYVFRQLGARCLAIIVVVAASACSNAQTSVDPATIVKSQENQSSKLAADWLGNDDARIRAWGAYLTLRDGRLEFLPQLIKLAELYRVKDNSLNSAEKDNHDAMLVVMDAIVQMFRRKFDASGPPRARKISACTGNSGYSLVAVSGATFPPI